MHNRHQHDTDDGQAIGEEFRHV